MASAVLLLVLNTLEVRKDQLWKVRAIASLEKAHHGQSSLPEVLPQPVEIFGFQGLLRQWVSRVRIKPCGNEQEFRFRFQQLVERAGQDLAVFTSRRMRGQG